MDALKKKYEIDKQVWDDCAETYERQIVGGHPDILAFEDFEEDFLDRMLRYLAETQQRPIKLLDIGCGSGRLHVRYGAKTEDITGLPVTHPLLALKKNNPKLAYDSHIARGLKEVWGIDFSQNMINLALEKLKQLELDQPKNSKLTFDQGSAFELKEESKEVLPVAVCLVNSIGVMQGAKGAMELFKSMRRAVEAANGIAIISNYQKEYVNSYALGQYESTMDVSGQPRWMVPDIYATEEYQQIPRSYKLAHSKDDTLTVDVYRNGCDLVKKGHILTRDPKLTEKVIETGDIDTYSDYQSHWYSYRQMDEWIENYWDASQSWHIKTKMLDALRAEAAQLSILDFGNHLKDLFIKWKVA